MSVSTRMRWCRFSARRERRRSIRANGAVCSYGRGKRKALPTGGPMATLAPLCEGWLMLFNAGLERSKGDMARGCVVKRCALCRRLGQKQSLPCNHDERVYGIFYRVRISRFSRPSVQARRKRNRSSNRLCLKSTRTEIELKESTFEDFTERGSRIMQR